MSQAETLLQNECIEECGRPWGFIIVLAENTHQEHVTKIEDFIWSMCVSYRKINEIRKTFKFTIPCCDDAIISVGAGSGTTFIIIIDARQGYHQVVRKIDKEKLALFAPNKKITASVSCPLAQKMHQDSTLPRCAVLKRNGT